MSQAPLASFPTVCAAPFVALHLDPRGRVRACCENRLYTLGTVPEQSLLDIWRGDRLAELRGAMRRSDLELGCEGCERAIVTGSRHEARVGLYDNEVVDDPAPSLPVRLELELSNRCNLECVMCNGELSSAIRARREQLPPLPKVYGDEFFDELGELAPTLSHVGFLGGEPFLGPEPLRAFEVLAGHGFRGRCHVTTNGTVANDRVARLLDTLTVDVSISIDGATAETVEAIRRGVDHARLMENVQWFHDIARRRGTRLAMHYCLMPSNWHELHPFLAWADQDDLDVVIIPVRHPMSMNLEQLDVARLQEVVAHMACQETDGPPLGRNASAWAAVSARLRDLAQPVSTADVPRPRRRPTDNPTHAVLELWADTRGVHHLDVGGEGLILSAGPDPADVLGIDLTPLVGQHSKLLLDALIARFGELHRARLLPSHTGTEDRLLEFDGPQGRTTIRAVLESTGTDDTATWHLAARQGDARAVMEGRRPA